jgi:RNA polymerase sigma-70 factor (ECF subfamily)
LVEDREASLIDECLAGRTDAFGELVKPYQDRLYNTLYRVLGSREDAAEALQEALILAYRNLASFHRESSFFTWLYRVAVNSAMSLRRRRPTREAAFDDDFRAVAEPAVAVDPGRNLEREERRQLIEKALAGVPDLFRAALVMKEIDGLKYEEIAKVLDLPIGTVRSRLHRARQEMRRRLKPLIDAGVI